MCLGKPTKRGLRVGAVAGFGLALLPAMAPSGAELDPTELRPGGAATADVTTDRAYSQFVPNLDFVGQGDFKRGDMLFRGVHQGLGPLVNARTCQTCHVHDGRGNPPASPDEPMVSMFLRLSIPGDWGPSGVVPDPTYGDQLQTFGVVGNNPRDSLPVHDGALNGGPALGEGYAFIEYQPMPGRYPDGTVYTLQQPVYVVRDLAYGPFAVGVQFSPRLAPPIFGMGLLEAIPAADIAALADPHDVDGDGISGRLNQVWDRRAESPAPGRFGLKANQPSILQQLAGAYQGDLGISNSLFPHEPCAPAQAACLKAASQERNRGAELDASDLDLALVEFYSRTLAVPPRRAADHPDVLEGKLLFQESGCAACHVPRHQTGTLPGSVLGAIDGLFLAPGAEPVRAVSQQTIWPYTDLLLHDMGGACEPVRRETAEGETCDAGAACLWVQRCSGLADGRSDFSATGREWRTPPLWGIGLTKTVNPRAGYLHDGRARTLEEAILWHGGEASDSRDQFAALDAAQRQQMLRFLESL